MTTKSRDPGTGLRALLWPITAGDIILDGVALPGHLDGARTLGDATKERYADVSLSIPPLDRALEYLKGTGQLPHQLLLVATDRPANSAGHRDDTVTWGPVIDRRARERFGVQQKVRTHRLTLGEMSVEGRAREMRPWFSTWASGYRSIHLLMNLSLPSVTMALLMGLLEVDMEWVSPLDVLPGGEVRPTDVIRRVSASGRRRDIKLAIEHGRFGAALSLLPDDEEVLGLPGCAHRTLHAVLESTDRRLRFDLRGARESLMQARKEGGLPEALYDRVVRLQICLPTADDPAGLLRELYHNACYKLRYGEFADLVLRLFNFQQAALRQAAERQGVKFVRRGEYLDRAWLDGQSQFVEYAACWKMPDGTTGLQIGEGRATAPILLCLAAFLGSEQRLTRDVVSAANRVQGVVDLRNRCFAAHDFAQVTWDGIAERFHGDRRDLLDAMWTLHAGATGRDVGPDPLRESAELCSHLLELHPSW